MSLDLDAIEHRATTMRELPAYQTQLALVARVRELEAEIARRDAADEFREGCEAFDRSFDG